MSKPATKPRPTTDEALDALERVMTEVRDQGRQLAMHHWFVPADTVDEGDGCGTVACAAGWAATDPWFQERGLHLKPLANLAPSARGRVTIGCAFAHPSAEGYQALATFFGLPDETAEYLFDPLHYHRFDRPDEVLEHIDLVRTDPEAALEAVMRLRDSTH